MHIHSRLIGLNSVYSNGLVTEAYSISSDSVKLSVEALSNQDLNRNKMDESSKINDNFSAKVESTPYSCAQSNEQKVETKVDNSIEGKVMINIANSEEETLSIFTITTPTHSGGDSVYTKDPNKNCKPESIITDSSNAIPLSIESNYKLDEKIETSEIEV